jgi:hypothetical protein
LNWRIPEYESDVSHRASLVRFVSLNLIKNIGTEKSCPGWAKASNVLVGMTATNNTDVLEHGRIILI